MTELRKEYSDLQAEVLLQLSKRKAVAFDDSPLYELIDSFTGAIEDINIVEFQGDGKILVEYIPQEYDAPQLRSIDALTLDSKITLLESIEAAGRLEVPLEISEEQFFEEFQPLQNDMVEDSAFGGIKYETYGDELEFVKKAPSNTVWTIIASGDAIQYSSGFWTVNRIGYILTKEAWQEDIIVQLDLTY